MKSKTAAWVIPVIVVVIVLGPSLYNRVMPREPEGPLFMGYRSGVYRIEVTELDVVEQASRHTELEVDHGGRSENGERFKIPSFLGTGRFYMNYGSGTDSTHYHYEYLSNETGLLNTFWEKLGYYFNMSEARLEQEEQSIRYDEDGRGKHFGSMIDGKPIWSRVIEDCGVETGRDTSWVGEVLLEFDTGAEFRLRTYYLRISLVTECEDGAEVKATLRMDDETDIELEVVCEERVDDPKEFFSTIFKVVGIPQSVLEDIELDEVLAAICGNSIQ